MLIQTKKELLISFRQLLEKRNLLLFCSCSTVPQRLFTVYQGTSDLDMFVWLRIPIKSLRAVTFLSLATKWIRFCKQEKKNYYKYIDVLMEIWLVNIYVRDMSDFSGCDSRSHIMLSSKFVKFILETIVYVLAYMYLWLILRCTHNICQSLRWVDIHDHQLDGLWWKTGIKW